MEVQKHIKWVMTSSLLFALVMLIAVSGVPAVAVPLESDVIYGPLTNPENGHKYYLLDTATWTESEMAAVALGGHLVTINDAEENDWVFDEFAQVALNHQGGYCILWIGLNDASTEGTFVWSSGDDANYRNWSPGQPDNARGTEDYVHMWIADPSTPSVNRMWNDLDNSWPGMPGYGVVEVAPTLVDIDIKPGSYPNSINLNGHGVIPVAVLGNADFDVTQVDLSTLEFAGLDVRVKGNDRPQCAFEDVSGDFGVLEGAPDGYVDLVCHFVDDPSQWTASSTSAELEGYLFDGTWILGTDTISMVP